MMMRSKWNLFPGVVFILLFFACASSVGAADPAGQIVVDYGVVLKASPMPPGEKTQLIPVGSDESASVAVGRYAPGAELKPHFHKTHSETVYVIEGAGLRTIEGKEINVKPGSIHFNPMGKVHAIKNTGNVDMIFLSIFTPAMKGPDRVYVP
jgi:quercetin dioxygenase-like cupin family protein